MARDITRPSSPVPGRRRRAIHTIRWFAPNRFTALPLPALRRLGFGVAVDGNAAADLAVTMAGSTARAAFEYSRRVGCPLVVYVWDLQPWRVGTGRFDPVWAFGRHLVRLPRPFGGYAERRGYLSRLPLHRRRGG